MGECQLRSGEGQTRHMYLVLLAHTLLMAQLRQGRKWPSPAPRTGRSPQPPLEGWLTGREAKHPFEGVSRGHRVTGRTRP